jgi:hypothetical protein
MRGAKTEQQMNVISHAADRLRNRFESPRHAAQISMKSFTPLGTDKRALVFGAEDDVNVKTEVRRGHEGIFQRPCRGAKKFWDVPPGMLSPAKVRQPSGLGHLVPFKMDFRRRANHAPGLLGAMARG